MVDLVEWQFLVGVVVQQHGCSHRCLENVAQHRWTKEDVEHFEREVEADVEFAVHSDIVVVDLGIVEGVVVAAVVEVVVVGSVVGQQGHDILDLDNVVEEQR